MKIYLLSGLGLQSTVFSRLDFGARTVLPIEWLEPEKGEALHGYVRRISERIEGEDVVLIGLSFGGIVGVELSRIIPIRELILISSLRSVAQKPRWLGVFKFLPLYRLFSLNFFLKTLPIWGPLFGVHGAAQRRMFSRMFGSSSDRYLHWAIRQVIHWNGADPEVPTFHVHGDQDRIFPITRITPVHVIEGGDHGMVVSKAREVSRMLNAELDRLEGRTQSSAPD